MSVNEIRTLYQYLVWAHERLMPEVQRLSAEELTRDLGSSFPSVHATLVHLMSAEWIWLSRWHGVFPTAMLDPASFPTLDAIEERWTGIRRELARFLGAVRDEDLDRPFTYRNTSGEEFTLPLAAAMQHVVNHNTYHRGQIASMLRQLGRAAPATDLSVFYREEEVLAESERDREPATFVPSGPEDDAEPEDD